MRDFIFQIENIGWFATSLFTLSYIVKTERGLLLLQATSAIVWIIYGCLIHTLPMVVANVIVAAGAGYRVTRMWLQSRSQLSRPSA